MSAFPDHPHSTTPAPVYSEAPELTHPTPINQGPSQTPGPISPEATGQSQSNMHNQPPFANREEQYPFQPDHVGEVPTYDANPPAPREKDYPNQPQGQPQQFYTPSGHPSGYATAVPLHAVQSAPCPVDCPVCGQREMTRTNPISGGTTHGWAAILCFCCCLGCIPYLMSSLKDVEHSCGKCSAKLATWHNSGRVQVLQNGPKK